MNNLELVKYTVLFSIAVAYLFYLCFNTTKNRAKLLAKELKGSAYFHKYKIPSPWIRKHFHLKKEHYPPFLIFEFYFSMFYLIAAVVVPVVVIINLKIGFLLFWVVTGLTIVNILGLLMMYCIYKFKKHR